MFVKGIEDSLDACTALMGPILIRQIPKQSKEYPNWLTEVKGEADS